MVKPGASFPGLAGFVGASPHRLLASRGAKNPAPCVSARPRGAEHSRVGSSGHSQALPCPASGARPGPGSGQKAAHLPNRVLKIDIVHRGGDARAAGVPLGWKEKQTASAARSGVPGGGENPAEGSFWGICERFLNVLPQVCPAGWARCSSHHLALPGWWFGGGDVQQPMAAAQIF